MTMKDISYFTRSTPRISDERGRSLIEMLGTIGIITMITVGAITGSNTALEMWKANQTQEQVMEIIQGITDMYSWNKYGWADADLSHETLCKNADFSSCEGEDNQRIKLETGDHITIIGKNNSNGVGTILEITVENVKNSVYNHLANKVDGKLITSITCSGGGCSKGNRGNKNITFIHNAEAVQ